jgi:hypothetical protein
VRHYSNDQDNRVLNTNTYIWINVYYFNPRDDAVKHIVIFFFRKENTFGVMLVAINIYGNQAIDDLQRKRLVQSCF